MSTWTMPLITRRSSTRALPRVSPEILFGGWPYAGSASLSASGLKQQDIVILHEASAARAFEARFEQIRAEATPLGKPGNLLARARRSSITDGETAPPAGCLIKGNVSRKGVRIYHVPGGRTYNRVRINGERGERWFCTEEQAVTAGWRKAGGGKSSL